MDIRKVACSENEFILTLTHFIIGRRGTGVIYHHKIKMLHIVYDNSKILPYIHDVISAVGT